MVSDKPWRQDAVLLLGAAVLLSLSVGAMARILLNKWLLHQSLAAQAFLGFMIATISFQGVGLVLLTLFSKAHEMNWKEFLGLNSPSWKKALRWVFIAGLLVIPTTILLNELCAWIIKYFTHTTQEQMVMQVLRQTTGWAQRIFFGFSVIVLAPIVEESIFRGILYPFIKQREGRALAIVSTSLLFAFIHFNLQTFVPLTFLAVMLVLVYEATDVLLAPIALHALFNAVNFSLSFILPIK